LFVILRGKVGKKYCSELKATPKFNDDRTIPIIVDKDRTREDSSRNHANTKGDAGGGQTPNMANAKIMTQHPRETSSPRTAVGKVSRGEKHTQSTGLTIAIKLRSVIQ
jgi:hypothetical protein